MAQLPYSARRLGVRVLCAAICVLIAAPCIAASNSHLTLPNAVSMALTVNKNLVASKIAAEFSLSAARAEFDLKIVPTATLGRIDNNALSTATGANNSYGAQLRKKLETGATVSLGPSLNRSGGTSNTTLNLGIVQPLLKGFGSDINLDGIRRAEFSVNSSRRSLQQTSLNTALDAIGAYYEALKQLQLAELNESLSQRLKRHALIARSKERVGLASPMDTYRAEIRLKDAEDAANQARNAYQNTLDRLKLILDLNLDSEIQLFAPSLPELGVADPEGDAINNRIEIAQLRAELEEANRAVDLAANGLLPEVSLQVNYGRATTTDPYLAQLLPTTQRQWNVSLQASGDLWRTAEKGNYRRAQLRVDALRLNLDTKIAEIRRQARQQVLALAEAKQRIDLRQEQIKQAEGKLALAEVKFAHDMADNFDVIEAEAELQRARTNLLATEADYAVGIYNLKAMTGHLLDTPPLARHTAER